MNSRHEIVKRYKVIRKRGLKPLFILHLADDHLLHGSAQHRDHRFSKFRFCKRSIRSDFSTHANQHAAGRRLAGISSMNANPTRFCNRLVIEQRQFPFELWRLAVFDVVNATRNNLGLIFKRVANYSSIEQQMAHNGRFSAAIAHQYKIQHFSLNRQ